jgi:hypothetical protein
MKGLEFKDNRKRTTVHDLSKLTDDQWKQLFEQVGFSVNPVTKNLIWVGKHKPLDL